MTGMPFSFLFYKAHSHIVLNTSCLHTCTMVYVEECPFDDSYSSAIVSPGTPAVDLLNVADWGGEFGLCFRWWYALGFLPCY